MIGYDDNEEASSTMDSVHTNSLLTQTFFKMFLGLLATAIVAIYTFSSGFYVEILSTDIYNFIVIAELVVVITIPLFSKFLSPGIVTCLFFLYSILNGLTFSGIFAIFEISSVAYVFLATATIFGGLAYLGKTTEKDLSNYGTILSVALLVGIVFTLINFLIGSSLIEIGLSWAMLVIFMGFTVYDVNQINFMASRYSHEYTEFLSVYLAMDLYLDFINMFLKILYLFGKPRD